ncbi:hypothetical protein QLL95_gp1049 [Cotonvirus japonicus]|uniref:Uncharacterized protein n=1 Tax=Cotonvirus japonicus TaxID=2811091 RepID=A0ABM7NSD7_9VIRU|nr:hypothetical protein QLL95_gp1049 [Cotonvirus japonicus]BCS83074.1 hypothetical protein [Cotonvirus japonicus]
MNKTQEIGQNSVNSTLESVATALDRVNQETKESIFQFAKSTNELDLIVMFNNKAVDLFNILATLSKKAGMDKKYNISYYRSLFDRAIKANCKLPVDKFTLLILEYAPEIYEQNEDCFLDMKMPDKKVSLGNEFSIIRTEEFKELWKTLNHETKQNVGEEVLQLTTYAHAYFYKSLLSQYSKNK